MPLAYHHHNTADEVREYLDTARKIVDELGLDIELTRTAFELAVNLLSTKAMIGAPDIITARPGNGFA